MGKRGAKKRRCAVLGGFMAKEIPYSRIDPREMEDLEAEFGRTLTPELAQCLIRYRINRDAIELMLRNASAPGSVGVSEIKPASKSEDLSEDTESEDQLRSRQHGTRRAARKAVA
jgi:hypothetical protein